MSDMGHEVRTIKQSDDVFPESLKSLPKNRSPNEIFIQGEISDFTKCIAIVGTRKCSKEGQELAHEIAVQLSVNGYTIVSGLAKGIDIAAHAGAVENEEKTKLVLVGCISLILLQAMIHIGVNIRLFPTTGMTLPFISYGGSSIVSISILSGIILNLTKRKIT